ncbi:hypothetical protein [Roseisolibacter agri]|uniref:Uncharacterized protein n=1 Tax=Roseisolibacter agri TaxID=2014610 RepID=A0AA37Q0H0_9BACT|nr:hypothetical protein [Roseisolibacter agri]GLC24380.1 hypothetical protein rosag_08930 [Roseisolibacter agri]
MRLARRCTLALALVATTASLLGAQPSVLPIEEAEEAAAWMMVPRLPMHLATETLVSRDGAAALLLTGDAVVAQLTDDGVARETYAAPARQPRVARLVASFLANFRRAAPDRAVRCDLRRVADVQVDAAGHVLLTGHDGTRINVTGAHGRHDRFDPVAARAFAARVRAAAEMRRATGGT